MKKIAVLTNITKDTSLKMAERVAAYLDGRAEVYMADSSKLFNDYGVEYVPYEEIFNHVDIAIVIGGDGTLLRAATDCAMAKVPAVGINLGTVGFLTEVEVADLEDALDALLEGRYTTEKRTLLKAVINDGEDVCHVLNDIVVSKRDHEQLIHIDLYADGELVYHYKADGLIIATPTGSTGYSISAGGPVVDPSMDLVVATPICAHMLLARSAVLSADKELVIKLGRNNAIISADGQKHRMFTSYDTVKITKSEYKFELIKIGKSSFYNTLINKLS